jgi:acetyl esterase/lipase
MLEHLSEPARAALLRPAVRVRYPDRDDRAGWDALIELMNQQIGASIPPLSDLPVTVDTADVNGVPTFQARPHGRTPAADEPVYLDLHGGGLLYCGGSLCGRITARTAVMTGLCTWGVNYRMPPAHPFPAALDDCVAVYRHLIRSRPAAKVIVGGMSAGGNLAAATLLRARAAGLPMPGGLVLLTPELDLTESGDTFTTNAPHDNVLASLMPINMLYADGHDLADPHLSPLLGDVSGFPPTLLQSGTRDLLLSNTVRMHRALLAAHVPAELHVFEAMPHGGFGPSPERDDLDATVRRFIDGVLNQ